MIVPMKRLTVVCRAATTERTLDILRDLKCLHVDAAAAPSAARLKAAEDEARAVEAVRILSKAAGEARALPPERSSLAPADDFPPDRLGSAEAVLAADAARKEALAKVERLQRLVKAYAPYGDFDPALARELLRRGIDLKGVAALPDPLPEKRLSLLREELSEAERRRDALTLALARARTEVPRLVSAYPMLHDRLAFAAARDALGQAGTLAYLQGWIAADAVPAVRAKAVKEGWGILVRDPAADEVPPTWVRPPKFFRSVTALFDALGIAPAYTEADVSVPFFCYFSLFFAMLVGDGGYGALLLAGTLFAWRKTKPREGEGHRPRLVRAWLTLMSVFSGLTVIWGVLSNTWFGASIPVLNVADISSAWVRVPALAFNGIFNSPAVAWLGDPSYANMMLLCFTIGASHLVLARVWNGICLINDRTALAQFGWAGVIVFMYILTNVFVGVFAAIPAWAYWMLAVSLVLVFGFTLKGAEFKTRGIELGMLPLNVMGAMGDIISYVRLFAVGLASVKVAENFNEMALGLDLPWFVKIVPMVLILLVGHALNFVMAGLSILVHAVRLNTLEFSSHKGVSWAGYRFSPFKKSQN